MFCCNVVKLKVLLLTMLAGISLAYSNSLFATDHLIKDRIVILEDTNGETVELFSEDIISVGYSERLRLEYGITSEAEYNPANRTLKLSNLMFLVGNTPYPIRYYRPTSVLVPGLERERIAGSICKALGFQTSVNRRSIWPKNYSEIQTTATLSNSLKLAYTYNERSADGMMFGGWLTGTSCR